MIVATAGHVDHGKTSLIRALTSVDTDRLPEERKRGMTIDLGFAYLPVEAGPGKPPVDSIGFIDVPGHERFVRNLLCGLSGIDLALLVIAADDGPMPQTIEHLSILDLLEVPGGAVVLTRIDRVSDARIAQVRAQIEAMCVGTALSGAPVFPVCCLDGRGIDALKEHLLSAARASVRRSPTGNFRLAIDRVFNVSGTGLIVTGTAASGSVHIGIPCARPTAPPFACVRCTFTTASGIRPGRTALRAEPRGTGRRRRFDRARRLDRRPAGALAHGEMGRSIQSSWQRTEGRRERNAGIRAPRDCTRACANLLAGRKGGRSRK